MTMPYRHYLETWVVLRPSYDHDIRHYLGTWVVLRPSYDHDIQTLPRDMGGA